MKHVFVETNWVVAYCAPAYVQLPTALELARRAQNGEIRLYLPSVCLTEARHPIRTKYHPRNSAASVRKYLAWAEGSKALTDEFAIARRILDQYEATVIADLQQLEDRLIAVRMHPGIEVFPLDDSMLARAVDLTTEQLDLKPFDQAILAAVLVRATDLNRQGENDISFCELDSDLQPWDKHGRRKNPWRNSTRTLEFRFTENSRWKVRLGKCLLLRIDSTCSERNCAPSARS